MNSDSIRFSSRKSIYTCQTSSRLDFSSINTDLEGEKKEQLFMILSKYSEYFIEGMPVRRVTTGELKIDLIDPHKTVQRRPHQMSPSEKVILREKIQSLLDADIIRESSSPSDSPIVLVKKKDHTDRLCVDYRELNANTRPEHYPLPRIEEQVDRLNGAQFFSSLDMAAGYHQVRVSPESMERTAFVTPDGQFEYLAMPFGLRWAASTYQRCINKALKSLKYTVALAYMDDVLSYSSSVDEGLQRLDAVLRALTEAGRRTTEVESRYHSYELETLAVVRAVESFRLYLYGQHFTVYTDCNSLKASKAKTDLSPRVHRWWAFLQAYDFDIIYKEGRHMAHADFPSRNPLPSPLDSGELSIPSLDSNITDFRKSVNFVELHNSWIQVEQKRDQEIQNLISQHEKGELPGAIAHTYDVRDSILYRKVERNKISPWLPIVPRSLALSTLLSEQYLNLCSGAASIRHLRGEADVLERLVLAPGAKHVAERAVAELVQRRG
ncbi:unnamed protein product [Arctia plantaginis]|uniref:Reverse transcriptase domain-containing protein n=1 Tax=Arctia plantaginis TaxID=874455 RepID=A0A8S0ZLJ9_ARCPL|nr:unnamed protein product [Arctia plantaginis]